MPNSRTWKRQPFETELVEEGRRRFRAELLDWLSQEKEQPQELPVDDLDLLYWAEQVRVWASFEKEKPSHLPLGIPLADSVSRPLPDLLNALRHASSHPSPRIDPRAVWEQGFMTCLLKTYLPLDRYSILDIGCGKGFMAGLCERYYPKSRYVGLDILDSEIEFCRQEFARSEKEFSLIRGGHSVYRPSDTSTAEDLPLPDGSMDLVFGLSLWTHLPPSVALQYLAETARVLRPCGYFVATFHLLGQDSIAKERPSYLFNTPFPEHTGFLFQTSTNPVITSRRDPVAVQEAFLVSALSELGLAVIEIKPGAWRSEPGKSSGHPQDCVIARLGGSPEREPPKLGMCQQVSLDRP